MRAAPDLRKLTRWRPHGPNGLLLTIEESVGGNRTERAIAVRLKTEGLLIVHARGWITQQDLAALKILGQPEMALSLTGRDQAGIGVLAHEFPHVVAVGSPGVRKRLRGKVTAGIHELKRLQVLLPPGARLLRPEGLDGREVWLLAPTTMGNALLTGEAFLNLSALPTDTRGLFQRAAGLKTGLQMSPGFRRRHVTDLGTFRAWAFRMLRDHKPTVLLPPEGRKMEDSNLASRLRHLIEGLK